jgi:uncharacterized repeat protein (TIGR01451 family)
MKRFLLALFSVWCLLFSLEGKAQYVTIPDPAFAAYLHNNPYFSSCINGNLLDTACARTIYYPYWRIQILNPSNSNPVTNLEGVQYFTGLITLEVSNCSLQSLPAVWPPNLVSLTLDNDHLTEITSLPAGLQSFHCADNSDLDSITAFPQSLKTLMICRNNLYNLPPLPSGLQELYINNNHLDGTFYMNDSLKIFFAGDNLIDTLICNSVIRRISAGPDELKYISPLPPTIDTFLVGFNQLASLPALPNSISLLDVSYNLLSSIPSFPLALNYGVIIGNNISSLPPFPPGLYGFECGYNQLTSLPPFPPTLMDFECSHNQITSLPALNSNMFLDISYNPITCIPPIDSIDWFMHDSTLIGCRPSPVYINADIPQGFNNLPLCDMTNVNSCATGYNIHGNIYIDANNNCIKDASESPLSNIPVLLYRNNILVAQTVPYNGSYFFDTAIDSFLVVVDTTGLPFLVDCASGIDSLVILTTSDSLAANVSFGLRCKTGTDLGVVSIVQPWTVLFPGQQSAFILNCGDLSNSYGTSINCGGSISGNIAVTYSGPVSFNMSIPGHLSPDSVIGSTLYYTIADFSSFQFNQDIGFYLLTDTAAQAGDSVCMQVSISTPIQDNNIFNNTYSQCFSVVNSFDPNIKEVSPPSPLQYPFNDWLIYTIHFQNTGTFQAYNIRVADQLDPDLDPSSFELLSYSHAVQTSIQNHSLTFNFFNINLPDSSSNEALSHGFVQYRIKPYPNRPYNTDIANTANIYFDYNPPVTTNTTHSLITDLHVGLDKQSDAIATRLYPNPAHNSLTIQNTKAGYSYLISAIDGKIVRSGYSDKTSTTLDISELGNSAVYIVKVISEKGVTVSKFIKQ